MRYEIIFFIDCARCGERSLCAASEMNNLR